MDERLLFERFHEALDVDPRPAAYERMRSALIKSTSTPRRSAAFHMRWTKMGFRLAAAVALVALAAIIGAVIISTHRVAQNNVPAGPDAHTVAYQRLMSQDDARMALSTSNHCNDISDTGCPAAAGKVTATLQLWLDDLAAFPTPSQFAVADAEMRLHLNATIADLNAAATAVTNQNAAELSAAIAAALDESGWIDDMVTAITTRHAVSKAVYVQFVRSEKASLDGCSDCQNVVSVTQDPCPGSSLLTCRSLTSTLSEFESELEGFETGLVISVAPGSIAGLDGTLRMDLAAADATLLDMIAATISGDWSRFNADRNAVGTELAGVDRDSSSIIGA